LPFFFSLFRPSAAVIFTLSYTTLFRSGIGLLDVARVVLAVVVFQRLRGNVRFQRVLLIGQGRKLDCHRCTPLEWALGKVPRRAADRKSTRLNSSHVSISYAVFCLKKKK